MINPRRDHIAKTGDPRRYPDMWYAYCNTYVDIQEELTPLRSGYDRQIVRLAIAKVCKLDDDLAEIVTCVYRDSETFANVLDACIDEQDRRDRAHDP